jgi:acetylornithine deacetylase
MKGGLIAHAYAAKALRDNGVSLEGDLILQAVVGEEVGDHLAGTSAVLDAGYVADAVIVCEPTNFHDGPPVLSPVAPGVLWFSVTVEGKTAHSGFRGHALHSVLDGQRLGVNAVDKMWVIYNALRNLEDEWAQRDRHELFTPGHFSILPGVVRANPRGIEVPSFLADIATIEYCAVYHPDRSSEDVVAEIERVVQLACALDPWLRECPPRFDWKLNWPAFSTPADHALLPTLMSAHEEALGGSSAGPVQRGFFSVCDVTWLDQRGIPGIIYGPGVATTAHAENEYVPLHQLITAAKVYALASMDFCGVAEDATGHES